MVVYTDKERKSILRGIQEQVGKGFGVWESVKKAGISIPTYKNWVAKFGEEYRAKPLASINSFAESIAMEIAGEEEEIEEEITEDEDQDETIERLNKEADLLRSEINRLQCSTEKLMEENHALHSACAVIEQERAKIRIRSEALEAIVADLLIERRSFEKF